MTSPEISPPPAAGAGRPAAGTGTTVAGPGTAAAAPGAGTGTGTALALLVSAALAAVACLTAVYAADASARTAVAWGGGAAGVVLCVAVTVAARAVLTGRRLRAALAAGNARAAERERADAYFADAVVPAVVDRLRRGGSAETALAEAPAAAGETQRRVLVTLAREVHKGENMRAAAMSACANAAGRVQALATGMAADLREMEHRHADEDVLADLLHLDHRTAQTGRIADSIAVLTGARSGRRWAKPIVMESILRGAMGRISGYQRVRLHSASEVAIAGHAAEGVMHALAELMDNAANFSPPTSEVHVYVEEVAAGVVITIEDGGLVMGEVALRRAQQAVSAEHNDLSTLSGTRLGLAVVGRLARKHGLSVSFRPSAHGGTGVLVRIPRELVTEPRRAESGHGAPAAEPAPAAAVPARNRGLLSAAPAGDTHTRQPEPAPATRGPALGHGGNESSRTGEHESARTGEHESLRTGEHESSRTGEYATAAPPPQEFGTSGLPKRRRGQTLAAVARASASRSSATGSSPDATEESGARERDRDPAAARTKRPSGARFGDFRRAVQGAAPSDEETTESRDKTPEPGATGRHPTAPDAPSPARSSPFSEDDTE
ncbi:ATP-binding protein [Streptomyces tubbatahanensis]|uniref:histidine kinase n=1 Tax=Streptomyces tubbatahanensis TaxID=2923272 RepID=A0ABY3Y033_9ACTN|nr:ATP-binding protein [Streptomyces tubbatahanensis]UNS99995.1 ATP-binding protein [Streptomyces tubbatahanensis]